MRKLLLLPLLLVFSVPAYATSDLHPLDMKLEQEGFSSLIAQEEIPLFEDCIDSGQALDGAEEGTEYVSNNQMTNPNCPE